MVHCCILLILEKFDILNVGNNIIGVKMVKFKYIDNSVTIKEFNDRKIKYAFLDIDGTFSLIRNWPPVMSIVLDYVSNEGIFEGYDNDDNLRRIIEKTGTKPLPDTDKFCIESAGLSALTQMEWAIRRAINNGKIDIYCDKEDNLEKINRISRGEEVFEKEDTKELKLFLEEHTPRLFRFYEKVLNGYCRDKNLELAKKDPNRFIVPGSKEFLLYLKQNGVKNYFVTGAVVEKGKGMYEEVVTLGFDIGEDKIIDDIIGSTWNEKLPKDVIMEQLLKKLGASGDEVIVVGDGRSEISAGVKMNALCISRLDNEEEYKRKLHKNLGTHIIINDYTSDDFKELMSDTL